MEKKDANGIVPQKPDGLVKVISDQNQLGDLIKPLVRDIHLFDSFVAGTTHLEDPEVLKDIEPGEKLTLRREENKFDDNAILILKKDGRKLGYVPEKDNIVFARLMDAGKLLEARISDIEKKGSFTRISIGIYMIDF
ncbi:MAG: HIRAN domain-containing protein [Anaerovoracaceae bacterium]|nr:HIRAN domain-containing protein [Bacillota bacterium]MDY2670783.1 HIRAN domain-containing protein [Anaerovoracaceae bacterium]